MSAWLAVEQREADGCITGWNAVHAGTGLRLFGQILMHPQEMLLDSVLTIWNSARVTGRARRLWHSLTSCCGGCYMMCCSEMLHVLWVFYSMFWINMGEGEAEVKGFIQQLESGSDRLNLSLPECSS